MNEFKPNLKTMTGTKSAFTLQKKTTLTSNPNYINYMKKRFMRQQFKGDKRHDGNQVSQDSSESKRKQPTSQDCDDDCSRKGGNSKLYQKVTFTSNWEPRLDWKVGGKGSLWEGPLPFPKGQKVGGTWL